MDPLVAPGVLQNETREPRGHGLPPRRRPGLIAVPRPPFAVQLAGDSRQEAEHRRPVGRGVSPRPNEPDPIPVLGQPIAPDASLIRAEIQRRGKGPRPTGGEPQQCAIALPRHAAGQHRQTRGHTGDRQVEGLGAPGRKEPDRRARQAYPLALERGMHRREGPEGLQDIDGVGLPGPGGGRARPRLHAAAATGAGSRTPSPIIASGR